MSRMSFAEEASTQEFKGSLKCGRRLKEGLFHIYHKLLEFKRLDLFGFTFGLLLCYFQVLYFALDSNVAFCATVD